MKNSCELQFNWNELNFEVAHVYRRRRADMDKVEEEAEEDVEDGNKSTEIKYTAPRWLGTDANADADLG